MNPNNYKRDEVGIDFNKWLVASLVEIRNLVECIVFELSIYDIINICFGLMALQKKTDVDLEDFLLNTFHAIISPGDPYF